MSINAAKHNRVLDLCLRLLEGEIVDKQEAAAQYGVNSRSIQRDIDDLRVFFSEKTTADGIRRDVVYDRKHNGYRYNSDENDKLSNGEALSVCKVLLESRGFRKDELFPMMEKIISGCVPKTRVKAIKNMLLNEKHCYVEPRHGQKLVDTVYTLGQAIQSQHLVLIEYQKMKNQATVQRLVQPVGIMFSEFYFYLTAFIENIDRETEFEVKNDLFPTIYRIDRIKAIRVLTEHFQVPYKDRFQEGEFRKRVQFMYGGTLQTITFEYSGPSIDSVLDRLPTAEILSEKDGVYTVRAEVFGKGIEMWLRSQGDYITTVCREEE